MRLGVTSSTGWPSSVGHRRTLLVGDGPVSRVRYGPVPIHAPTPPVGGNLCPSPASPVRALWKPVSMPMLLRSRDPENIGNAKQPLWTAVGAIIWQDDILYKGTKMMYT